MSHPSIIRVGFWKSPQEPDLPMPKEDRRVNDPGFLKKLSTVEQHLMNDRVPTGEVTTYKGAASCRICGVPNGNHEYTLNGFCWPEGFTHYLRDHGVKLPKAFRQMIVRAYREV